MTPGEAKTAALKAKEEKRRMVFIIGRLCFVAIYFVSLMFFLSKATIGGSDSDGRWRDRGRLCGGIMGNLIGVQTMGAPPLLKPLPGPF